MKIGVPTETKNREYRVGLTPESVAELCLHGHQVLVQSGAGLGMGASDADYLAVGASLTEAAAEVFATSEMIVKVKEPQAAERAMLKPEQILFTYLHLAADRPQTDDLRQSGAVCIAYETVTDQQGALPLLKPMSQVAGRLAIQAGAAMLEKKNNGRGVLLGGVTGVAPGKVLIIGGGVVGQNAAEMAVGLQADVTLLDRNLNTLERLQSHFENRARVLYSNTATLEQELLQADLVIGAVLIPGASAPKLVRREHLTRMKPGAVLVDVAIDQGGCFESSHPTSHDEPSYSVDEIVHYCVSNMPGAVPRTSSYALNHATLPYVLALADKGWQAACRDDAGLAQGLNVSDGKIRHAAVAEALGLEYLPMAWR